MKKLEERGKIRVVRRGSGNEPNIYKGKVIATPPNTEVHSDEGVSLDSKPEIGGGAT